MHPADQAWRSTWTGSFRSADELLPALDADSSGTAGAWAMALRAARAVAEPEKGAWPDPGAVQALAADPSTAEALGALCAELEKAALLSFDVDSLRSWANLHRTVASGTPHQRLAELMVEALDVDGADPAERLEALASDAAQAGAADVVIVATTLGALSSMSRGDLEAARLKARRASRMARTEGLPYPEYLANIMLARLRRVTGKAHLAARILSALSQVAPAPYYGWLGWELLLAGETERGGELARAAVGPPALLADLLAAAADGDRERFGTLGNELQGKLAAVAPLRLDAASVLTAIDPDSDLDSASPELRDWCQGRFDEPPTGLHGLCIRPDESEHVGASVAFVVASRDELPRRVLARGVAFAAGQDAAELLASARKLGRPDTAIAVLALAGSEGLDDEAFFRTTYGFEYDAARHRGVFDVLKHRVRKQLGDRAALGRRGEHNVIELRRQLVLPDPRCAQPIGDAALRALAAGGATAKELAAQLGVPLRTAQHALKQLVEEGACVSTREGRQIHYVLEDTTFSEPTRV